MSIVVSNVTKTYGKQKALHAVSFEIKTGEILGFLGPNGAGKSTMMKIITTYLPQTEGTVEVCGFDVAESPLEVRKRVGYLPEHNPLYLEMYVREYLEFVAGLTQSPKSRVDEMIALTGLTPEKTKKIGQLSKGYRQRVGIAQALLHDPEVLILDEPTSGLDPNQLVGIRDLIKSIGKTKTIMLSTHIMQEVEALCDRVIIINKGEIQTDNTIASLKSLGNRSKIKVTFEEVREYKPLHTIEGVHEVSDLGGGAFLLTCDAEKQINKRIFDFAVKHDLTIIEITKQEVSMENVFQSLTKS